MDHQSERLRAAFELFEMGVRLERQNLSRRFPAATATELDKLLESWLHEHPGAPHGDGAGRPRRKSA